MIRMKVLKLKGLVFVLKENNNNNKEVSWDYWFIIITNPSQTNPKPKLYIRPAF